MTGVIPYDDDYFLFWQYRSQGTSMSAHISAKEKKNHSKSSFQLHLRLIFYVDSVLHYEDIKSENNVYI